MPQIILNCNSIKDTQSSIISVEDFKLKYLYGLPLEKDGVTIPDDIFINMIDVAVQQVEMLLNLKLKKVIITEQKDFRYDDWVHWSYVKATYPVVCPVSLDGYLGTTKQAAYPRQWLTARKTDDGKLYSRILYMVPAYGAASGNQNSIVVSGIIPSLNWFAAYRGNGHIPCYWTLSYVTGWTKVPAEILDAVCKIAVVQLLPIISDMLMGNANSNIQGSGVGWGISSKSISIDGLSQSLSSTAPQSGIFGARMKEYKDALGDTAGKNSGELQRIIDYYKDLNWIVG